MPPVARRGGVSETVHRYWQMLRLVPRAPRRIDSASIERLLANEGIEIGRRSIQRELESLATSFPALCCDRRSKPYGWAWDRDAPTLEVPGMSLSQAVTFDLVRAYLTQALPRATLRSLSPYFERARETLERSQGTRLARWPRKVRVVPRGQAMLPANIASKVLDVVYGALLEERRLRATYKPRGASKEKEYEINPLGLVLRDGALVLVCTFRGYEDVRHVLLHRMSHAQLLDAAVAVPKGFDLDAHVEQGGVAFRRGGRIKLRALVGTQLAITLSETPLASDQKLVPHDAARQVLEATVSDTTELRGWISMYGAGIEILAPASLRKEVSDGARALARMYAGGVNTGGRSGCSGPGAPPGR
jgi:predicted DNA-binding transcriptional regulator YafY